MLKTWSRKVDDEEEESKKDKGFKDATNEGGSTDVSRKFSRSNPQKSPIHKKETWSRKVDDEEENSKEEKGSKEDDPEKMT